jgi:drug/metabolite transporter (DMT)-like permease
MSSVPIATAGRPLTVGAVALMLMLCVTWGFNQIAIKLVLPDIPPYLQAMLRSSGALAVILSIAAIRGTPMFVRDGTLRAGLFAGLLFGLEFVLIYHGLQFTSASRASVFLYTAPFFVAAGSYPFLGERLRAVQWIGLAVSFAGVAFAIGVPQPDVDAQVLLGDLMIVAGAALWAATTLCAKATALARCPPEKALGYQVAASIPILGLAALISGETIPHMPGIQTLVLMAWQAIWVVGMTFLIWFSLVKVHSASKLSAFTFLTPLVGVAGGYFILHDPLTPAFGVAAVLVIAGLYLVNRPAKAG